VPSRQIFVVVTDKYDGNDRVQFAFAKVIDAGTPPKETVLAGVIEDVDDKCSYTSSSFQLTSSSSGNEFDLVINST